MEAPPSTTLLPSTTAANNATTLIPSNTTAAPTSHHPADGNLPEVFDSWWLAVLFSFGAFTIALLLFIIGRLIKYSIFCRSRCHCCYCGVKDEALLIFENETERGGDSASASQSASSSKNRVADDVGDDDASLPLVRSSAARKNGSSLTNPEQPSYGSLGRASEHTNNYAVQTATPPEHGGARGENERDSYAPRSVADV